ncbi:MAG: hypothetical protein HOV79_34455 [Hamadaea sp.]|nr:hypothetical protein [Hamadaea sp.]
MRAHTTPAQALRRSDQLIDALLAAALAALVVAGVMTPDPAVTYDFRPANASAVLLALTLSLPLAVRRRWPGPVLLATTASIFLLAAGRWNTGDGAFCQMIALYSVAAWSRLRTAVACLALTYAAMGGLAVLRAPFFDSPLALVSVVAVTVAWAFGRGMRARRAARERAVSRALQAEATRAVAEERAVLGERLRIARELHDVVAHTLSVIAVQSAVARFQIGATGPVGTALAAVEQASRSALDDLRRMLGVLRAGGSASPEPGLPTGDEQARSRDTVRESMVDAAVAAALAAFAIASAFIDDPSTTLDDARPTPIVLLLVLAASLPLAVRRRWPVTVLGVSAAATFGVAALGAQHDVTGFCAYVALYTVAAWRSWRVALAALGLVTAADLGLALLQPLGYEITGDLGGPAAALIPFGLGLIVHRWRDQRHTALERAREAERTRALAAERAAFAERLRIAGELHDVVSHTLSAIAVQSAVARHGLGDQPDAAHPAGPALVAIEEASRAALDDLRRMLGALGTEPPGDGTAAGLRPAPGLAELHLLASAHRAAHGPVELAVDPGVDATPDSLRLTAYRLVQEALTNVRKHAPGAAAHVLVQARDGDVVVQVQDDGPGAAAREPGGYGLAGMRERVALFGGTLQAGPRDEGGFLVRAVLRTAAHPQQEVTA